MYQKDYLGNRPEEDNAHFKVAIKEMGIRQCNHEDRRHAMHPRRWARATTMPSSRCPTPSLPVVHLPTPLCRTLVYASMAATAVLRLKDVRDPSPPEFFGCVCVPLRAAEAKDCYANDSGGTPDGQGDAIEAKLREIARCGDKDGERAAILGHRLWPQKMMVGDNENDNQLHAVSPPRNRQHGLSTR